MDDERREWDTWLAEHMITCETCRDAFDGSGEQGMSDVAFQKCQEICRKHRDES